MRVNNWNGGKCTSKCCTVSVVTVTINDNIHRSGARTIHNCTPLTTDCIVRLSCSKRCGIKRSDFSGSGTTPEVLDLYTENHSESGSAIEGRINQAQPPRCEIKRSDFSGSGTTPEVRDLYIKNHSESGSTAEGRINQVQPTRCRIKRI
jgi:hypothetical protein